jgi:hypothetical protein
VKGLVSGFAENAYKKTKLESAQQENHEQSWKCEFDYMHVSDCPRY